jgi:2-polyprenyl-3-methyl-5-hydroxy-6-metoxy-1,4-benzoquinol methylase
MEQILQESCRACGGMLSSTKSYEIGGRSYQYSDWRSYQYADCLTCGSITFLGDPNVDYTGHTDDPLALRDYLEMNASVDGLAALTVGLLGDMPSGKLIDIGCGFGFGCDSMRRLKGWNVMGYEPSDYGAVGHELLGFPLRAEYFDVCSLDSKQSLSAVVASEVVEHLDDPRSFFATIAAAVGPRGRFVLTTPNAALLERRPWNLMSGRVLGALSPGYHRAVFSRDGLERLLRESGFERFTIYEDEATLRCVTGVEDHPFPTVAEQLDLGVGYADSVLLDLDRRSIALDDWRRLSLLEGMRFRRFRYLVDLGRYEQAQSALVELGAMRSIPRPAPDSFEGFMHAFRCFEPSLAYYVGLLEFVSNELEAATRFFEDSISLCELKMKLAPSIAVTEEDLVWRARFHLAAIADKRGEQFAAAAAYKTIVEAARESRVPLDIVERCRERVAGESPEQEDDSHRIDSRTWWEKFPERARGKARYEISKLLRRRG